MSFHAFKGSSASLSIEVASSSTMKAFHLFSSALILSWKLVGWPPTVVLRLFQQPDKNKQQDKRKHILWNFAPSFKRAPGHSQKEAPFPIEKRAYLLSKALSLMSGKVWAVPVHFCYHFESLNFHKSWCISRPLKSTHVLIFFFVCCFHPM